MSIEKSIAILKRGTEEIINEEELKKKLQQSAQNNKPLKVKLGLDPTAPDIHIGHTVQLRKLRDFQDLGHEVILIIGDFTGRVGDPSGKSETRKQLTEQEVMANAKTYEAQFTKVLDPQKTKLVFNSKWFMSWRAEDFLKLTSSCTVARMLERDDFESRYRAGKPISILEFMYPLLQGYDSVAIEADVELGGTDQKFNLLLGRQMQKEYNQEPQILVISPLLEGTDGVNKMSKSLNNYIGINEHPNQIFGKTMSIADNLIIRYMRLATDLAPDDIDSWEQGLSQGTFHPMEAKKVLARRLVSMYYDQERALAAEQEFTKVFSNKDLPQEIAEESIAPEWLENDEIKLLVLLQKFNLIDSKSEGRRLIEQGGVYLDGERIKDKDYTFQPLSGMIIKVGKRRFKKIK